MQLKIERLLYLTLYLLNHDVASARQLAQHFQVSVRTIQRDMASLQAAGIPVYVEGGPRGGYAILPEYKLKNQIIQESDVRMILKALQSLSTAYANAHLNQLIEKCAAIAQRGEEPRVYWDFSVTRENNAVQTANEQLECAIAERRIIRFHYRNADGRQSDRTAEPLAIHYKWYAWYLFAWDVARQQYRTYKVARMSDLSVTSEISARAHGDVAALMRQSEAEYYRGCDEIVLECRAEDRKLIEEYFPDAPIKPAPEGRLCATICVPQRERLWQALILSFGDRIKVISPADYREKLLNAARGFVAENEKS
ncbi:MAG: WYL domain-containing protein [Clostridia bacterium]|nr:WYL domain-containing protein [Clostridia bacterium]